MPLNMHFMEFDHETFPNTFYHVHSLCYDMFSIKHIGGLSLTPSLLWIKIIIRPLKGKIEVSLKIQHDPAKSSPETSINTL